eukprot:TRINITY_DN52059_c0_g1_i1.p1 TRINITY_DN52059_c0_g1~~TRINITY_DN52059_c0_g1_i1.p1  ORF type:complete len:130 (+),score=16.91 TRINITY_DN52059_c0_g1_i1:37-390(+)
MDIASMGTALVLLVLASVTCLFIYRFFSWFRTWRRKQKRLDDINEKYECLRSARGDAVYHHGWAMSRGEHKEAKAHELHVIELDRKLAILKKQYEAAENGEIPQIDGVYVDERHKDK